MCTKYDDLSAKYSDMCSRYNDVLTKFGQVISQFLSFLPWFLILIWDESQQANLAVSAWETEAARLDRDLHEAISIASDVTSPFAPCESCLPSSKQIA